MAMPGTVQSVSFSTHRRNTIRLDGPLRLRLLPESDRITAAGQEPAGEKTRSITHLILLANMARRNPCSSVGSAALPGPAQCAAAGHALCASGFARSAPLRYTDDRSAWRSLPSPPVSKEPSGADTRSAPGCRPVRAVVPAAHPADRGDARSVTSSDQSESASQRAAGSTGGPVRPTLQVRDAGEALQLFLDNLLQDVPVEAQVRDQPLQLVVLFTQLAQFTQFA